MADMQMTCFGNLGMFSHFLTTWHGRSECFELLLVKRWPVGQSWPLMSFDSVRYIIEEYLNFLLF